jgi:hypothetical protein
MVAPDVGPRRDYRLDIRTATGRLNEYVSGSNHFIRDDDGRVSFGYVFGVGYESHSWAEVNVFTFSPSVNQDRIIKHWKGQAIAGLGR